MADQDSADKDAEELLPNAWWSRPAVAAKLREMHARELDGYRKRDEEIERLEVRFPCGHRKIDWDDSYGECVFCKFRQMAFDYDNLPHSVIAAHAIIEDQRDEIERLKVENICAVCAGSGKPSSGNPCICGGTGKACDEAQHAREMVYDLQKEVERLKAESASRLEALERIARPDGCGCNPCRGQCLSENSLRIWREEVQCLARAEIDRAKGEKA